MKISAFWGVSLGLAIVQLSAGAAPARAGEFESAWANFNGQHLHRTEYKLVDPEGDAYIIRMALRSWKGGLKRFLQGQQSGNQQTSQNVVSPTSFMETSFAFAPDDFRPGTEAPLDVATFLTRVRQETAPSGHQPSISPEHQWSTSAQLYLRLVAGNAVPSKLFCLLSTAWVRMYTVSGQEAALKAWIMSRPLRSVEMHDVFRESYALNRGDLYLALLTAENVLSADQMAELRQYTPLQKHLAYVRNDSVPHGDNFGAWYHFFGAALYGLVRSATTSQAVVRIEDIGSAYFEPKDAQEKYMNILGARFGVALRAAQRAGGWNAGLPAGLVEYRNRSGR